MKIKPIKPTLKAKKRYLAFEIISKDKIDDFNAISSEIWTKTSHFLGEKTLSEAHLVVLKDTWNPKTQKGLIKINHTHVEALKAALCLLDNINKIPAIITIKGISGIMKKAKTRYLAI